MIGGDVPGPGKSWGEGEFHVPSSGEVVFDMNANYHIGCRIDCGV
jgi:hypothetical protein